MSERCEDCIINRTSSPDEYGAIMESLRIIPDDPSDSIRLAGQLNGENLAEALRMERPARCVRLQKLLPEPPTEGINRRPLAVCPEVGMIALLHEGEEQPTELY